MKQEEDAQWRQHSAAGLVLQNSVKRAKKSYRIPNVDSETVSSDRFLFGV